MIVAVARAHFRSAANDPRNQALPDAGWRWHAYCVKARERIAELTHPLEIIHSVQRPGAGFEARMTGEALAEHTALLERVCVQLFPDFVDRLASFAETELSAPETVTEINGRLVSTPLYNHVMHTLRCLSFDRPKRVLEIGGGYGAPGRVWMTNDAHRPDFYVDVDFPESLFFAEVYLRATMPHLPIGYFGEEASDLKTGILLCPIARLGDLLAQHDFDLIVNTGSMQEMSEAYVEFYMQAIARARCDAFYSANYFAQPIGELLESMNFAAPVLRPDWSAVASYFHDSGSRSVAEVFYRRIGRRRGAVREIWRLITAGQPRNGQEFMALFDAARRLGSPGPLSPYRWILSHVTRATMNRMPSVPKEALFLARPARDNRLLNRLETLAASGRDQMGIVEPDVASIRQRLMQA